MQLNVFIDDKIIARNGLKLCCVGRSSSWDLVCQQNHVWKFYKDSGEELHESCLFVGEA